MFVVLKLFWPFLFKFVMKQASENAAAYLEARRQRRYGGNTEIGQIESDAVVIWENDEEFSNSSSMSCPPSPSFLNSDAFWYTLSGISLGVAASMIGAIVTRVFGKMQ